MQIFENIIRLRGFLGKNAETPRSDRFSRSSFATLNVCVDSGYWDKHQNIWVARTVSHKIICVGPYFCALCMDLKRGDFIEIEGELQATDAANTVRVLRLRRLEYPSIEIDEGEDG